MSRQIVTVQKSGRFTLPVAIRRELDLQPGDSLVWSERDGEILFRKAEPHEVTEATNNPDEQASTGRGADIGTEE